MIKLRHLIIDEYFLPKGLSITHNIDTTINMIQKWFSKLNVTSSGDKMLFKVKNLENISDDLEFDGMLKIINNLGWFPASMISNLKNPRSWKMVAPIVQKFDLKLSKEWIKNKWLSTISFEPKYDPQLNQDDVPDVAYHMSPTNNEEKILKIGLSPRSKEKLSSHPERIYFTNTDDSAENILNSSAFRKNNTSFTLFKVDLKSLKKSRVIRFFPDLNYVHHGFYTYENIPPEFLSVVKRLKTA